MLSIIPSAAIAAILLLCVVYFLVQSVRLPKQMKAEQDRLVANIYKERETWQNQVNDYKEIYEYYYKEAEKYRNLFFERGTKIPYYEFILGDKITGWVWTEMFEDHKPVNIGDMVKLRKSDTEEIDCIVEKFNGICQYKDYTPYISFNVSERSLNNA